jgi:hypothetical protein
MQARLIACVFPLLTAAHPAAAQDEYCRSFSWSIGREIDLFDEPLPVVKNAQSIPKEGAFALALKPVADVIYMIAPDRGSDSGNGGVVTIESLQAGRYQIAISAEAWVDAVQDNKRLTMAAFSRDEKCPGVRRSVEVEVKGEPLTLQVGGAKVDRLKIAVLRIWPFAWRW